MLFTPYLDMTRRPRGLGDIPAKGQAKILDECALKVAAAMAQSSELPFRLPNTEEMLRESEHRGSHY